jgi:hypothetical protein
MLTSRFWTLTAAAAAVLLSSAALPGSDATARSYKDYICLTDEGGGRLRPCSANYKSNNPNWRGGETCFTDEGYGRYRPCSANYKAQQNKKAGAAEKK